MVFYTRFLPPAVASQINIILVQMDSPLKVIFMKLLFTVLILLYSFSASASGGGGSELQILDLTDSWVGITALIIFGLAYVVVIFEEQIHIRKSKPVLLAAGLIWVIIGIAYSSAGIDHTVQESIRHNFLEYSELFFFLLVAMTYIDAMLERGVFDELRDKLVARSFSYKRLFWITGLLAFFISPIADNLTTALIMCAVVMTVGKDSPKFIVLACINIVVGANAGGAFSPFGDITTLMVWQKGILGFTDFFALFIPSLVNFLVPAIIMQFALPSGQPCAPTSVSDTPSLKKGGLVIAVLFLATIVTAVCVHNFLHIPPVFGMMLGLAYLKLYGFYLRRIAAINNRFSDTPHKKDEHEIHSNNEAFDVFDRIAHAEWDTLFFFYGVIMAVGGLGLIGYLSMTSSLMYGELGATNANILVGLLSAVVDNIPVMFAVLTMNPDMPASQWLLVTLTAGVGGSLLSIGSAAGVALMGQAKGHYTFFAHLKWTPVIALGYAASIWAHFLINT